MYLYLKKKKLIQGNRKILLHIKKIRKNIFLDLRFSLKESHTLFTIYLEPE